MERYRRSDRLAPRRGLLRVRADIRVPHAGLLHRFAVLGLSNFSGFDVRKQNPVAIGLGRRRLLAYLFIASTRVLVALAYHFEVTAAFCGPFIVILAVLFLWKAVYSQSSNVL